MNETEHPRIVLLETAIEIVQEVLMEMGSPDRERLNSFAREIIRQLEEADLTRQSDQARQGTP